VDTIAHVIACLTIRACRQRRTIDPLRDVTNLVLELIFSDLDQIDKRLERLEKI